MRLPFYSSFLPNENIKHHSDFMQYNFVMYKTLYSGPSLWNDDGYANLSETTGAGTENTNKQPVGTFYKAL